MMGSPNHRNGTLKISGKSNRIFEAEIPQGIQGIHHPRSARWEGIPIPKVSQISGFPAIRNSWNPRIDTSQIRNPWKSSLTSIPVFHRCPQHVFEFRVWQLVHGDIASILLAVTWSTDSASYSKHGHHGIVAGKRRARKLTRQKSRDQQLIGNSNWRI